MVNALNKILFLYFLLYTTAATIDNDEIFSCNITANAIEEKINIDYETKPIQDGRNLLS